MLYTDKECNLISDQTGLDNVTYKSVYPYYSVISTLIDRAKAVYSNQQLSLQEQTHLKEVLQKCKCPM